MSDSGIITFYGKCFGLIPMQVLQKKIVLGFRKMVRFRNFPYLEQPMLVNQYKILKKESFANWMADEDCQNIDSLEVLALYYKSVNTKLMKCVGLTPALEMIQKAEELNYKIMIGCMKESSVGISAGCVLYRLADFIDLGSKPYFP